VCYGDARFETLNRLMTNIFEWLEERENDC